MSLFDNVRGFLSAPGSLRRRAFNAVGWGIAEMSASHVLRLASNLLMTRLLLPDAFGVMAMVLTLHVAMGLFTDIGIHQSIVRSPDGEDPLVLRVAWTVQILRSVAIAAAILLAGIALWLIGPVLAPADSVYADADLPFLIMASSLAVIFGGFTSSNVWLAARRLEFARVTFINIGSQLIGMIAMIGLGLIYPSVWSLLTGMLAGGAVRMLFSHVALEGPRMSFAWDRKVTNEFWHYGKWILGSSVFGFLSGQADRFILGAFLDKRTFGTYVIAAMWIEALRMVIRKVNDQAGFNLLSEIANKNNERLGASFGKYLRFFDVLCIFGFVGALFVGPLIIEYLYTDEYISSSVFIVFLSITIINMRFLPHSVLMLTLGDSRGVMIYSIVSGALRVALLVFSFRMLGIEWALLSMALSPLAAAPILIKGRSRILHSGIANDISWVLFILFIILIIGYFSAI